jgi:hypothetical protein
VQPSGNWSVGCDGVCTLVPAKIDKCGVCGGTGAKSTVLHTFIYIYICYSFYMYVKHSYIYILYIYIYT